METRLLELRKQHGLNQADICNILGISEQKYRRLEHGQFNDSYIV